MRNALVLTFIGLIIIGCGKTSATKNVQAPSLISASFVIAPVNTTRTAADLTPSDDHAKIRINKSSLEKEFLWHAEMVQQLSVPKFNGLKSRVVAFRLRGDTLYMIEATQGHAITTELPQTLILAAMPVTFQDDTVVEFDFNRGMAEVFVADDWRASDIDSAAYRGANEFVSVDLKHSYIHSAELNASNELIITQRAVAVQRLADGNVNLPIETRHYISPYIVNDGLTPITSVNFDRMGFFEVAPQLAPGSATVVYASRFDPRKEKTITYAISANTPEDYRSAIRDGILYWNRVFGYEKIKVILAPAGLTAPNSEYNIVQWVDWDGAGSAYADSQMDPRTGEVRHAQVFMTSAFAFSGRNRARALLRQLNSDKKDEKSFSIAGLAHSTLCDRDNSSPLHELLTDVLATNIPDSRILEVSQDYIREVVAHEVGHTLGLRHNFAGNMSANFDISNLDSIFAEYLKTESLPENIIFSSSVMEYQNFSSSVMSGHLLIKPNEGPLHYDKAAIDVLYNGAELNPATTPLFCTDSHMDRLIGCTAWDQGPSPLADMQYNERKAFDNLALGLVERIILSIAPPSNSPALKINEILLYPDRIANSLLSKRALVLMHLAEKVSDLRVLRSFSKVDALTEEAIAEKTLATTTAEVDRLGGLSGLLSLPSASLAANWIYTFNRLIESPAYREGVGYGGQAYKLSDEDVAQAKKLAEQYFTKIQSFLAQADIASLTSFTGTLGDSQLSYDFSTILENRMLEYILSESGAVIRDRIVLGENKTAMIALPVFKYSPAIRLAAAKLMLSRAAAAPDWGLIEHNKMKNIYQEKVKSILLGNEIESIRPDKNSREVSRWLLENRAILGAFSMRD